MWQEIRIKELEEELRKAMTAMEPFPSLEKSIEHADEVLSRTKNSCEIRYDVLCRELQEANKKAWRMESTFRYLQHYLNVIFLKGQKPDMEYIAKALHVELPYGYEVKPLNSSQDALGRATRRLMSADSP